MKLNKKLGQTSFSPLPMALNFCIRVFMGISTDLASRFETANTTAQAASIKGGPGYATETIMTTMIREGFNSGHNANACAFAVVFFVSCVLHDKADHMAAGALGGENMMYSASICPCQFSCSGA